ncbi:hypothetical protein TNCV_2404021 [Trichonephila clavipes]|nr:hypothetical protein TNCV_2404021 [Trichonephila clavipes]
MYSWLPVTAFFLVVQQNCRHDPHHDLPFPLQRVDSRFKLMKLPKNVIISDQLINLCQVDNRTLRMADTQTAFCVVCLGIVVNVYLRLVNHQAVICVFSSSDEIITTRTKTHLGGYKIFEELLRNHVPTPVYYGSPADIFLERHYEGPLAIAYKSTFLNRCGHGWSIGGEKREKDSPKSKTMKERKVRAKGKSLPNQNWKAHININGKEKADELSKEFRACPQSSNLTTLIDANAVASLD